jgi:hypothetical protein
MYSSLKLMEDRPACDSAAGGRNFARLFLSEMLPMADRKLVPCPPGGLESENVIKLGTQTSCIMIGTPSFLSSQN